MMRFGWKSPPEYFLCRVVRSHAERAGLSSTEGTFVVQTIQHFCVKGGSQ